MKVAFSDLPDSVKPFIKNILAHNVEMRPHALAVGGTLVLGTVSIPLVLCIPSEELRREALRTVPELLAPFVIGSVLSSAHENRIRSDYLSFFRALRKSANIPLLKSIMEKYPYLALDMSGNLVGKRSAPKFFVPIGRRVVPSPFNPAALDKWRRKYLPQRSRSPKRSSVK